MIVQISTASLRCTFPTAFERIKQRMTESMAFAETVVILPISPDSLRPPTIEELQSYCEYIYKIVVTNCK